MWSSSLRHDKMLALKFSVIIWSVLVAKVQPQTTRVVGGYPTTIDRYPIIVQLLRDRLGDQRFEQHCAGVIVTSRHVISTAHCFRHEAGKDYSNPKFWRIRVGSTFRTGGGSIYKLKKIISHEEFNSIYFHNDIAVLVVDKMKLNTNVMQSTLARKGVDIKHDSVCTIAGWGAEEIGGTQQDQLHFTFVFIIPRTECAERYKDKQAWIIDGMLCAGLLDHGGLDACVGDSGGPLMYKGVVIGLISFGYSCGHPYYPGVYTNISQYSDWINKTVVENK